MEKDTSTQTKSSLGMGHPLTGVIEKLRNADAHLDRLDAEISAYVKQGANAAIVTNRDESKGTGTFNLKVLRQPPAKISAIAGDIVHNLRSCLDYFIEESVKANGKTPTVQHQFPACLTPEAWKTELGKGRVYGLSDRATRIVDGFQPYHVSAQKRTNSPIWQVVKLSNRDKHHMLTVTALTADFSWKFVTNDGRIVRAGQTTEAVHDGGELAEFPLVFIIDGEKVKLQTQITITVGFNETDVRRIEVMYCLDRIRKFIGQLLLPAFLVVLGPLPPELVLTRHGLARAPNMPVPKLGERP